MPCKLSKDDIARSTLIMLAYQKEHENVIGLLFRMKQANGKTIDIANDLLVLEKSAEEIERLVNPELFSDVPVKVV